MRATRYRRCHLLFDSCLSPFGASSQARYHASTTLLANAMPAGTRLSRLRIPWLCSPTELRMWGITHAVRVSAQRMCESRTRRSSPRWKIPAKAGARLLPESCRDRGIEAAGMDEDIKSVELTEPPVDASRRAFIKGVIGSGAAAFSAGYLFRASPLVPELLAQAGVGERLITLNVNGQQR